MKRFLLAVFASYLLGVLYGIANAATPTWDFVGEPASPHFTHLLKDGQDLGRCVIGTGGYADLSGTWYDGVTVHFVADSIRKNGFE